MKETRPVAGFDMLRRRRGESRSLDRLRAHYDLEVQLARRLMNAPKAQRLSTYGLVYAELFAGVPDHPQCARRQTDERDHVDVQLRELHRHLGKAKVFLEIGAGDCRLSFAVCARVGRVVAIDVCDQLVDLDHAPEFLLLAVRRSEHSGAVRKRRRRLQQSADGASSPRRRTRATREHSPSAQARQRLLLCNTQPNQRTP
jgi:hypothetical protein